jgi:lysophospholipase L1-like esterase
MKNYLNQVFLLTLLVATLLAILSFFSEELTIAGFTLRKMDLFSAIRTSETTAPALPHPVQTSTDTISIDTTQAISPDTLPAYIPPPPPPSDSVQFGANFEDYTLSWPNGLQSFWQAIDSIRHGRTVRVAFFGDSFVEGDILIGDLRDSLQSVWGGAGVGFVPVTSEVAQFKRSLKHTYRGWKTQSIVKKSGQHPPFGINGFVYEPQPGATMRYEGADYFRHTRTWQELQLFYTATRPVDFVRELSGLPAATETLAATIEGKIGVWRWQSGQPDLRSAIFQFPDAEPLLLYGASLQSGSGIYIDNFSVRGNTGGKLRQISPAMMHEFQHLLRYDLVVVQLGLNAVTRTLDNIKWYRNELDQTFTHLRACFPNTPILLIGVPDRADNMDGELRTLPSVPAIVAMQRSLARQHRFLFYDIYRGMGGPGSMVTFANHRPAWANRDYTHLTHEGGKHVGRMLAQLLIKEKNKTVN